MEKSGLFQIDDIEKLFHLSVDSLSHYEKQVLRKSRQCALPISKTSSIYQ